MRGCVCLFQRRGRDCVCVGGGGRRGLCKLQNCIEIVQHVGRLHAPPTPNVPTCQQL
jgi:hypothetical protein